MASFFDGGVEHRDGATRDPDYPRYRYATVRNAQDLHNRFGDDQPTKTMPATSPAPASSSARGQARSQQRSKSQPWTVHLGAQPCVRSTGPFLRGGGGSGTGSPTCHVRCQSVGENPGSTSAMTIRPIDASNCAVCIVPDRRSHTRRVDPVCGNAPIGSHIAGASLARAR
jgi:hypothetical protein